MGIKLGPQVSYDLLKGKKFLVVDDFPQMRSSVKKMLESYGAVDIEDARNGEEAIKKIAKNKYDIILCDYSLGEDSRDGQQILEEAKHRGLLKHSTIFMMITAESTVEMVMGAVEYQPDDYLTKPFTKEVLLGRLDKMIDKKKLFSDIERAVAKKDFQGAMAMCDARSKENAKYMLDFFRFKGDLLLEMRDYEAATALFDKVLAIRTIPWALAGLGKISFHKQEYMQARDYFQQVIEENETYVEAYDWLSKTFEKLGDLDEAQEILQTAIKKSPKAILRQQALADVALKNKDMEVAERSLKAAVKIGKNSCFKNPSHYTKLARVVAETKNPLEALKVIGTVRDEFKDQGEAALQANVVEGVVYKKMGQEEKAKACLQEASKQFEAMGSKADVHTAMSLAKAYYEVGDKEKGNEMMQEIIRNHHEEESVLEEAKRIFEELNMTSEGSDLIDNSKDEIVQLNNSGVRLVKEGKLQEAIDFFEQAAEKLPENATMNMNAAQSLMMFMDKEGKNDRYLYRARQFLDRVGKTSPDNEKYRKLSSMYEKISASK